MLNIKSISSLQSGGNGDRKRELLVILKGKLEFSDEEKQDLWNRYIDDPEDIEAYEGLMEAYLPLVEILAAKMVSHLPPQVEVGDLVSEGFLGLVDAITKFDPSRGWKFETYATNRVRGEMTDSLRDLDWVSRYTRLKFKSISQTEAALTEELQRTPTEQEIADRLDWSLDELSKTRDQFNNSYIGNIDEQQADSTHEFFSLSEMVADETLGDIEFNLTLSELSDDVRSALFSLPKHKAIVVALHQLENKTFEEIAEKFNSSAHAVKSLYFEAISDVQDYLGMK